MSSVPGWNGAVTVCYGPEQGRNITPPFLESLPSSFQSVLIPVLYWLFVIAVPTVDPFVQVFRWSWVFRVFFMEFLELLRTAHEVLGGVLGRIRVVAFPASPVV